MIDYKDPVVRLRNIRKSFAALQVLKGVDLDVCKGENVVVLGRSGMGPAARIFGRGNTMLVHRIEELPGRLSELYFRLARR